jgi:uncharacterized protein (TIRG00374 family)
VSSSPSLGADALPSPASDARRRAFGALAWAVGFALLGGVVAYGLYTGEARQLWSLIVRARPAWLVAAAIAQLLTYVCAGAVWQLPLARAGERQRFVPMVWLGVAKVFTDQVLPSGGLSGTLLLMRGLARRGASRGVLAAALVDNILGFYAAFLVSAGVSLFVLWRMAAMGRLVLVMAVGLVGVAAAVVLVLLGLLRLGDAHPHGWLARAPIVRSLVGAMTDAPKDVVRDRVVLGGAFALQLVTFVLDALTLEFALVAVGERAPFSATFASFVFASIAETIGFVPGGLGTFEATCVAFLHMAGVPFGQALAGTLLLRGFTFWLPMLPGVWLWRHETAALVAARRRAARARLR